MAVAIAGLGTAAQPSAAAETGAGAMLDPTVAALPAHLLEQQLTWGRCSPDDPQELRCTTITAPLDYRQPHGDTITLAVSRIRTSTPDRRRGILTFNPGGPGTDGLYQPLSMLDALDPAVREQYDLVGFDPRGVGGSSPVRCGMTPEDADSLLGTPYTPETFDAHVARQRGIADRCAAAEPRIAHITTRNTARDMDLIRTVLGARKLSFIGASYGTYLGAVYMQMFAANADRIVLDSAVDPGQVWRGVFQAQSVGTRPAYERWTRWAAERDAEYGLGASPEQVDATFWEIVAAADRAPIELDGRRISGDEIRHWMRKRVFKVYTGSRYVADLKEALANSPEPARHERPAPPAPQVSSGEEDPPYDDNSSSALLAILCNEGTDWPRDTTVYARDSVRDKRLYPLSGDVTSNMLTCAAWTPQRVEPTTRVRNTVPALIVQNEWDSQTPLHGARGMHRVLEGSRLLVVKDNEGHGAFNADNACADDAVNTYLSTGEMPQRNVTCQGAPKPPLPPVDNPELPEV